MLGVYRDEVEELPGPFSDIEVWHFALSRLASSTWAA